ncbi:hypothetical protein SISNIDRAFT_71883 [Sistotremastrum niveocremeum HHB9708]|uniref:Uncharacterized protein n=2 Tax=Sistotremastraceae TaxID=3402574 RepID=A0A164V782_9AGAM|nr:hypothetical protein SISNIDRAFT_71883 [Sistotremastrum niveocremeum HHB9708]KZT36452.1 hypothetical protein SISSUDRAFT_67230 [Sistotremastrum suecicum HHB10207 ss-3]
MSWASIQLRFALSTVNYFLLSYSIYRGSILKLPAMCCESRTTRFSGLHAPVVLLFGTPSADLRRLSCLSLSLPFIGLLDNAFMVSGLVISQSHSLRDVSVTVGAKRNMKPLSTPCPSEVPLGLDFRNSIQKARVAGSVRLLCSTQCHLGVRCVHSGPDRVLQHVLRLGQVATFTPRMTFRCQRRLTSRFIQSSVVRQGNIYMCRYTTRTSRTVTALQVLR